MTTLPRPASVNRHMVAYVSRWTLNDGTDHDNDGVVGAETRIDAAACR
jgi:hypothetical protein